MAQPWSPRASSRAGGRLLALPTVTVALALTVGMLGFNLLHQMHRQVRTRRHGGPAVGHADRRRRPQHASLTEAQQYGEVSEVLQQRVAALEHELEMAHGQAAVPAVITAGVQSQGWYARIEDIPRGSAVWVTFVNGDESYREIMTNWALHLRELQVPHVVVAFDDIAARNCEQLGIPHLRCGI